MKKISLLIAVIALVAFSACKDDAKKEMSNEVEKTEETKQIKETKQSNNVIKNVLVHLESKSGSNATGKLFFNEIDGKKIIPFFP